jgi:hypothetical protein
MYQKKIYVFLIYLFSISSDTVLSGFSLANALLLTNSAQLRVKIFNMTFRFQTASTFAEIPSPVADRINEISTWQSTEHSDRRRGRIIT